MMDPDPGRMNTLIDRLVVMLRNSTAWQQWCGSGERASAAIYDTVADSDAEFPHCIIDLGTDQERTRDDAETRGFLITVDLWLAIFDHIPTTAASMRQYRKRLDAVLRDLETAPNDGDNLLIRRISLVGGPQFISDTNEPQPTCDIEVKWSLSLTEWP